MKDLSADDSAKLSESDILQAKAVLRAAAEKSSRKGVLNALAQWGVSGPVLRKAFSGEPIAPLVQTKLLAIANKGFGEVPVASETGPFGSPDHDEAAQLGLSAAARQTDRERSQPQGVVTWSPPMDDVEAGQLLAAGRASNWAPNELEAFYAMMDGRHAIVTMGNRVVISERHQDGSLSLHIERDLKLKYRPFYQEEVTARGSVRSISLFEKWLVSPSRPEYSDGISFSPGCSNKRQLNLWTGWATAPNASGSCELFLAHVRDVICNGEAESERYVLGWLAHLVQYPNEKPGVGLALRGGKGAGKDTIGEYVAMMIGTRYAPTIGEEDHLTGKFNSRIEAALLLHVQEASWAGNRKSEGVLKYLVTSERIEVERKGIDSYQVRSVLRLLLTANADWVVPASPDERRWCVLDVSNARAQDPGYFRALRDEMNGEGPSALLHFLLHYDISSFNVRQARGRGASAPDLRDERAAGVPGSWDGSEQRALCGDAAGRRTPSRAAESFGP